MEASNGSARGGALFLAALVLGLAVRLASLPLPGTGDMGVYRLWTYNAAVQNPARLYGVGGPPGEWHRLEFDGTDGVITYPPLAIYELGIAGRVYRLLNGGAFPNTIALVFAIKALILVFETGLIWMLFAGIRRLTNEATARWATMAYWLNPSMILAGSMLGYVDALAMLPAAAAVYASSSGWPLVSGALITAATLSKPQCLLLMPGTALVILGADDWRGMLTRALRYGAGVVLAAALILGPIVAIGAWPNLWFAMSGLARHDMLSGNATNLWWIIGYAVRVQHSLDMGVWNAITAETRILAISRFMEVGYPNPRVIGTSITILVMLWGLWTGRRARDWFLLSAVGAFLIHAYATLAAQVHENHLYSAVPLLVIAASRDTRYRRLLWVVSAIFALNLNVFYGISEFEYRGSYMVPRMMSVLDLTVWLSLASCATLVWHAVLLKRVCADPAVLERRGDYRRAITT
ncbi:MAG: hypothetical protein ABL961_11520 [Vicinamibacterales bacterium]